MHVPQSSPKTSMISPNNAVEMSTLILKEHDVGPIIVRIF